MDQVGGDVPCEDISDQSFADEEACKLKASKGGYSGGTYERVPKKEVEVRKEVKKESSKEATTTVIAVDKSDVLLAASVDRKLDWIQDVLTSIRGTSTDDEQHGEQSCWQRNSPVPHGKREWRNFESFQGKKGEMLQGRKTRRLYRLKGSVQIGGAAIRHRSSGISEKNGQREATVAQRHAKSNSWLMSNPTTYKLLEELQWWFAFKIAKYWPGRALEAPLSDWNWVKAWT
ncbi:hypothetical protein Acr_12g0004770 [Actinidia rufa]|uniref:Uncharacterized protein n=1 Tax=Actinidia rufa TaxID=165716 RepID=A0A7J0FHL6_9ERIC|nr:hypothetical protein Acr_12g0004770 [Actinidia rufa]